MRKSQNEVSPKGGVAFFVPFRNSKQFNPSENSSGNDESCLIGPNYSDIKDRYRGKHADSLIRKRKESEQNGSGKMRDRKKIESTTENESCATQSRTSERGYGNTRSSEGRIQNHEQESGISSLRKHRSVLTSGSTELNILDTSQLSKSKAKRMSSLRHPPRRVERDPSNKQPMTRASKIGGSLRHVNQSIRKTSPRHACIERTQSSPAAFVNAHSNLGDSSGRTQPSKKRNTLTTESTRSSVVRAFKSDTAVNQVRVSQRFDGKLLQEHNVSRSNKHVKDKHGTSYSKAKQVASANSTKNASNFADKTSKPSGQSRRDVIGVVGCGRAAVMDRSTLRRYALYRGMVDSTRLANYLDNVQQPSNDDTESVTSGRTISACSSRSGPIAPWEHELERYETRRMRRSLSPAIPEIVSEPDIPFSKWDLRGTTLPKRIYIRETVNGGIVDEIVDVRDEKDWAILTYMSPLRPADLRSVRKSRDIGFKDLNDFEVYCFVYPWKLKHD